MDVEFEFPLGLDQMISVRSNDGSTDPSRNSAPITLSNVLLAPPKMGRQRGPFSISYRLLSRKNTVWGIPTSMHLGFFVPSLEACLRSFVRKAGDPGLSRPR